MHGIFESLFGTLSETIMGFITQLFSALFGSILG